MTETRMTTTKNKWTKKVDQTLMVTSQLQTLWEWLFKRLQSFPRLPPKFFFFKQVWGNKNIKETKSVSPKSI